MSLILWLFEEVLDSLVENDVSAHENDSESTYPDLVIDLCLS